MNKKIYGMSVIELLVTFAIVAVLSAVMIPAYNKYTIRSKVAIMVNAATPAQIAMLNEFYDNNYDLNKINHPPNSTSYLVAQSSFVSDMEVDKGWIRINGTRELLGDRDIKLVFEPVFENNDVKWNCYSQATYHDFVPKECRQTACSVYQWGSYKVVDEGTTWMYNTSADPVSISNRWANYCASLPWYFGCECFGKSDTNLAEYSISHDFTVPVDHGWGWTYLVVRHSCKKRERELVTQASCATCPGGSNCVDVFDKFS